MSVLPYVDKETPKLQNEANRTYLSIDVDNTIRKGDETELTYILDEDVYNKTIEYWFEKEFGFIHRIPLWLYGFLIGLGIFLNLLNIIIFTRPAMKSPLIFLLSILEGINIVIFIAFIPDIAMNHDSNLYYNKEWSATYRVTDSLFESAMFYSNWLTVTVSVWRFFAVTWPLSAAKWCTKGKAVYAVLGISVSSVSIFVTLLSVRTVVESKYIVMENGNSTQPIFTTSLFIVRVNNNIVNLDVTTKVYYSIILFITMVPCITTLTTTTLLLVNLWKAKRRRSAISTGKKYSSNNYFSTKEQRNEERITVTLSFILALLVLAYIPDSVVATLLVINPDYQFNDSFILKLYNSEITIIISNCLTFVVYFGMSQNFRNTFFSMFNSLKSPLIDNSKASGELQPAAVI